MTDIILEVFRAVCLIGVLIYLHSVGRKENINHQDGWWYIPAGFVIILFGTLLDITDNFPSLNQYVIIGDTGYQAILEKIFGYLLGFILLAIGFWKWMPTIVQLKEARRDLKGANELLEFKVQDRTASLQHEIDIRKQAENQLRQNEERLEKLLHSIPAGIMIIDQETHEILSVNPKAVLMLGAPPEHFLGSQCHKFICPSEKGKCPVTDTGIKLESVECELINARGESIPILKTVIPYNADNRYLLIECFVDITDHKRVEKELRQQEKLQGVIEMAGGVCHELNQPMQVLLGYSELIMVDLEDGHPAYDRFASMIEQIDRMKTITQRLMSVTRYETTDYLDKKIVDINKASEVLTAPSTEDRYPGPEVSTPQFSL